MKSRVKWDEINLGDIERNKPVRQKITEPKTPYHPRTDDDSPFSPGGSFNDCTDDEMYADAICSALNEIASSSSSSSGKIADKSDAWPSSDDETTGPPPVDQDDEDEDSETERNSSTFREQRRAHYDEFQQVEEHRRKGSFMEDGSDEDFENGKANHDPSSSLTQGVRDIEIEDAQEQQSSSSSSLPPPKNGA
ncbi:protein phosphatase inhibitor 2 [Impatiens glandulifera]|uniref:protein phosphatase inhibitor 2 n=1 Tax=Impatiens glandulifera TaxID=253017 RepID=UPI001FB113CC|nr:protein phosphatase inhibitor 2 [Impatiens glandulifera]